MRPNDIHALMRMLERRASWLDKWRAKRRPGHWLNKLRRDLMIPPDGIEDVRELEAKNRAQAKMIAGYIALIGAATDAGMDFWWEGRTACADWSQEARRIAIPFNLNNYVSVRFTDTGEAIWIAFHEGKPPESEMPDPQGWRRIQLWHLFETFGKHIHVACQVPFDKNELRIAIPKAETRWPQVCYLCNHNMESEADRVEWHGLGNCVPICPTCNGSGSSAEEEKPRTFVHMCPGIACGGVLSSEGPNNAHLSAMTEDQRTQFRYCSKCDIWWPQREWIHTASPEAKEALKGRS